MIRLLHACTPIWALQCPGEIPAFHAPLIKASVVPVLASLLVPASSWPDYAQRHALIVLIDLCFARRSLAVEAVQQTRACTRNQTHAHAHAHSPSQGLPRLCIDIIKQAQEKGTYTQTHIHLYTLTQGHGTQDSGNGACPGPRVPVTIRSRG